jgi:hypothetical protein
MPMNCRTFFFAGVAFLGVGCSHQQQVQTASRALTIVAIGDGGERNRILHNNAALLNDMFAGKHDAGRPDALIFLGDNFYETGLNIPADEVEAKITDVLGPFQPVFEGLGRRHVHAIAGNHDYYARLVVDKSLLFGLINIQVGPIGLSERGSEREHAINSWSYYYRMPAAATYPIAPGSADSVQIIFYDSALPLRTEPATWRPALDSLRRLLLVASHRSDVKWRILCQHHPWYSVGEHGGYTVWDDEALVVRPLSNCDKDSNVVRWFINSIDPEDLCAPKYRRMIDSLRSVLQYAGAKVHLVLSGHDHSLQLLSRPPHTDDCPACPSVHVVSGAGSEETRVGFPSPPYDFTSPQQQEEGRSRSGFVQVRFEPERMGIRFFDSKTGEPLDMGGGKKEFWINRNGDLLP